MRVRIAKSLGPTGFFDRAALAMTSESAGTSLVMTEPVPMKAPSPTVTGATSAVLTPMNAFAPIVVLNFWKPL